MRRAALLIALFAPVCISCHLQKARNETVETNAPTESIGETGPAGIQAEPAGDQPRSSKDVARERNLAWIPPVGPVAPSQFQPFRRPGPDAPMHEAWRRMLRAEMGLGEGQASLHSLKTDRGTPRLLVTDRFVRSENELQRAIAEPAMLYCREYLKIDTIKLVHATSGATVGRLVYDAASGQCRVLR